MKPVRSSSSQPEPTADRDFTRREFLTVAALGAGALLSSGVNPEPVHGLNSMKYRKLGKSGISVSEIGFGSHLTRQNMGAPRARTAQIRKGLELGINLFDIYEHNHRQFGPMSQILGPVRQDVVISLVSVWPWAMENEQSGILQEVEYALQTFDTDFIDLYRLVVVKDASKSSVDSRLEPLQRAKEQGKIRAVGLVAHDQKKLVEMLRVYPELDFLMFPYNFRHRKLSPVSAEVDPPEEMAVAGRRDCTTVPCEDPEFAGLVRERGVGLIAIKPFGGGGLLRLKSSYPQLEKQQDAGVSFPQAALKFILEAREVACAIPAMNSIAEVVENAGAVQGNGLSRSEARCLQLYNEAAEQSAGTYLPEEYKWLEQWKV